MQPNFCTLWVHSFKFIIEKWATFLKSFYLRNLSNLDALIHFCNRCMPRDSKGIRTKPICLIVSDAKHEAQFGPPIVNER